MRYTKRIRTVILIYYREEVIHMSKFTTETVEKTRGYPAEIKPTMFCDAGAMP